MLLNEKFVRTCEVSEEGLSCDKRYVSHSSINDEAFPLTHNGCLWPVPIWMVVNDGVLAMSIVHLTSLATQLVQFNPGLLGRLTVKGTHWHNVCRGKKVCAIITVILDVEQRWEVWRGPDRRNHKTQNTHTSGARLYERATRSTQNSVIDTINLDCNSGYANVLSL